MFKKQRRRIAEFTRNLLASMSRRIATSRPVRWVCRLRVVQFLWRIVYLIWLFISKYVWWPVKRRIRRIRRFANRRDAFIWLATWGICGWMAWAILNEGILKALMFGLLVALVYVFISARSPMAGLMIWLLTSRFLAMYIVVKFIQGLPFFSGDRYCLIVLLGIYVLHARQASKDQTEAPNKLLHATMIVFICAMMFASLLSEKPKSTGQAVLDSYGAPFLVYLFARRWVTDKKKLAFAFGALMIVSLYFSLLGIPEYFTGKSFFGWRLGPGGIEGDIGVKRAQGPAESPTEFGLILTATGLLALAGFANESQPRKRFIYAVVFSLAMLAILLTLRRSIYLGTAVAFLFMFLSTKKTRKAVLAATAVGALVILFRWGSLTSSKVYTSRLTSMQPIYQRAAVYATSWEIIKRHPVRGVGLLNFPAYSDQYLTGYKDISPLYGKGIATPHNGYLKVMVEAGLLAFIPYMAFLVMLIVTTVRAYKRAEGTGLLGKDGVIVFLAFTAAVFQTAITEDLYWFSHYLMTVWMFYFGAIVGVHLKNEPATQKAPVPSEPVYASARRLKSELA